MKGDVESAAPGAVSRAGQNYEESTGQSAVTWIALAVLNVTTQAVFYWQTNHSGDEFGTLNAALGILGLMTIPVLALHHAFRLHLPQATLDDTRRKFLRNSSLIALETWSWIWGAVCLVLVLLPLPLPHLPEFPLQIITLLNVLLALGAVVGAAICDDPRQHRRWAILVLMAATVRLTMGASLMAFHPAAETALAAFLVAGFVTLTPALRSQDIDATTRLRACTEWTNRDFLLFAGATLSVFLSIYLFINADRIAAVQWNMVHPTSPGGPGHTEFDDYQAAGLCARSLLWGTQPLLWLLYAERSKLNKTTTAALTYFWIYLATLLVGAFIVGYVMHHLGKSPTGVLGIAEFGPTFAAVMVPLGLIQALAVFSLASRRYPECFVLGACSVAYALVLAWFGRRPDIMLPYMFGLALISIMLVLFVGVVRWGRKQP